MNTLQIKTKSDILGAMASFLCLIHCIAAPFLFVAQTGIIGHNEVHPIWWGFLDIVFLIISYFAVWWSSINTTKRWVRYALWSCWTILTIIVFNEKLAITPIPEVAIYFPTISLIFLHLYNRRYCQCGKETCCANNV